MEVSKSYLIDVMHKIQGHICAYSPPHPGKRTSFCDCKYGGDHVGETTENGNGCPEARFIAMILESMSESEFERIKNRNGVSLEKNPPQRMHKNTFNKTKNKKATINIKNISKCS